MAKELLLQVTPDIAANEIVLKEHIGRQIKVAPGEIQSCYFEGSIDARQKAIKINLKSLFT
jgi:hypothetical protein